MGFLDSKRIQSIFNYLKKKKLTSTFFIRRLKLLTLRMKLEPPNQRVVSKFLNFLIL